MKFPTLASTLRLLRPLTDSKVNTKANSKINNLSEKNLYDSIEEIITIYDIQTDSLEILNKFYQLSEIHQQILIVTLIEHNMVDTLKVITESSYNLNFLIRGQTPLHFAINNQNMDMVRILIEHNADLELDDHYKETALNCAVRKGSIDIIKYLLKQGADVNTHSSDRTSPLTFAVRQGDSEAVNILLKYGALLERAQLVRK